MAKIPEEVKIAIKKTSPICITTANDKKIPNIVYVAFLKQIDESTIVIADNKFVKTKENILSNPVMAFVVLDPDTKKAYQLKGSVEYVEQGDRFQYVTDWVHEKRPEMDPKAGVYMTINEIFCGDQKIA